jgi:hypothetical protein
MARLADGFDLVLADLGAQRVPRFRWPAWVLKSPNRDEHVFLWLQAEDRGTDTYAGGMFRIEFEKSVSSRPAGGLKGRALFFQLLTPGELRDVLNYQNSVISTLPQPSAAHVESYPEGLVRAVYLSWFHAQKGLDAVHPWLRYRLESDLDGWATTLRPMIGPMVTRAADYLQRDAVHLGKGALVNTHS